MAHYKEMLKFVPFLLFPSAILLLFGAIRWAVLSLGVVILFLASWDLIHVHWRSERARRLREIWKHMTFAEREQMHRMMSNTGYWWNPKWWVVNGIIGLPTFLVLYPIFFTEDWSRLFPLAFYVVAFLILLLLEIRVSLTLAPRWQKSLYDFYYSTQYAKEKGWDRKASGD